MTISIDPDALNNATQNLLAATAEFDSAGSSAPASIDGGAATSVVAGLIAGLCQDGALVLAGVEVLCETTSIAAEILLEENSAAAEVIQAEGASL